LVRRSLSVQESEVYKTLANSGRKILAQTALIVPT